MSFWPSFRLILSSLLLTISFVSCKDSVDNLLIDPACGLYLYTNGGSVRLYSDTTLMTEFNLTSKPRHTGDCNQTFVGGSLKRFTLNYPIENNPTVVGMDMEITMMVVNNQHWNVSKMLVNVRGSERNRSLDGEHEIVDEKIHIPNLFSYSCYNLSLHTKHTNTTKIRLGINLFRFQLQPIGRANKTIFYDSFDCSQWFTIPLWMGLITLILFTLIVALGICMVFDIKTMDRFEDPKGKMISVPVSD